MNESQFLSIKPKRMLVKPFKPASLPADVSFTSRNGRAGKLDCSARIALDLQQRIVLLDTLRSRQCPAPHAGVRLYCLVFSLRGPGHLSLIHISEPTRLGMISYAVFCLK